MAEITVQALKELINIFPQYASELTKIISSQSAVQSGMVQVADVSRVLKNQFETAGVALNSFSDSLKKLVETLGISFETLSSEIVDTQSEMGQLALAATSALEPIFFNVLPRGQEAFGQLGQAGQSAGQQIAREFGVLKPILDGIISKIPAIGRFGPALTQGLGRFFETADAANNLERNLAGVIARSGQLSETLVDNTGRFRELNDVTASFIANTFAVAQRTGTALPVVMDLGRAFSEIPGAANAANLSVQGLDGSITQLEAVLKVSTAFGLETSDVISKLKNNFLSLNMTTEESIQLLANVGSASQDLKIPFDTIQSAVQNTAEQFKLFGNNAQAALNIVEAFTPALRDSGLGPAAINEVVGSLTSGIRNLDVAQKAFISGAAGGRAGVQGAFQLDLALRQGRLDEVLATTTDAIQRQFGRPAVTLDEAAQDPAAAAAFLQQQELIKGFGLARDDATAQRILDALAAGSPEVLGEVIREGAQSDNDKLLNALNRGQQIQQRGNTILTEIANRTRAGALIQGRTNAESLRAVGLGGEGRAVDTTAVGATGDLIGAGGRTAITDERFKEEFVTDIVDNTSAKINNLIGFDIKEGFSGALGGLPVFDFLNRKRAEAGRRREAGIEEPKVTADRSAIPFFGAPRARPAAPPDINPPIGESITAPGGGATGRLNFGTDDGLRAGFARGAATPAPGGRVDVNIPPLKGDINITVTDDRVSVDANSEGDVRFKTQREERTRTLTGSSGG